MITREQAIVAFSEDTDLAAKAITALTEILKKAPRAIVMVWEDNEGVRSTSVPFSRALTEGMINIVYENIVGAPEVEDDE
jgi:hypothetical protein